MLKFSFWARFIKADSLSLKHDQKVAIPYWIEVKREMSRAVKKGLSFLTIRLVDNLKAIHSCLVHLKWILPLVTDPKHYSRGTKAYLKITRPSRIQLHRCQLTDHNFWHLI